MKNFFLMYSPPKQKYHQGFTLVELIVSLSLLIIVLFITNGALLNMTAINKKVQSTRTAIDELNFALDTMSRQIRTGTGYYCDGGQYYNDRLANYQYPPPLPPPQNCNGGDVSIAFKTADGGTVIYAFINGGMQRFIAPPSGNSGVYPPEGVFGAMVPGVVVTNLKFYVTGAEGSVSIDSNQPRVGIAIEGIAGADPRYQTSFKLYTSLTQRVPKN